MPKRALNLVDISRITESGELATTTFPSFFAAARMSFHSFSGLLCCTETETAKKTSIKMVVKRIGDERPATRNGKLMGMLTSPSSKRHRDGFRRWETWKESRMTVVSHPCEMFL